MSGVTAYERLVVASRAFLDPGWLPPPEDCAELADLHEEHLRLLGVCADAQTKIRDVTRARELAAQARDDALRDAIREGRDPDGVEMPEPDDAPLLEARRVFAAAYEVLEQFVARAQEQLNERAPDVHASVSNLVREAQAKRAEARRLLEEADRLEAEPRRLLNWLARYTVVVDPESSERRKASWLGPIAYSTLDTPVREQAPALFQEIAGLRSSESAEPPPATVVEVGSDEITPEEMEAMTHA